MGNQAGFRNLGVLVVISFAQGLITVVNRQRAVGNLEWLHGRRSDYR